MHVEQFTQTGQTYMHCSRTQSNAKKSWNNQFTSGHYPIEVANTFYWLDFVLLHRWDQATQLNKRLPRVVRYVKPIS